MAGFWELPESGMLSDAVEGEVLGEFRHSITNHVYSFILVRAILRKTPNGFAWLGKLDLLSQPMSTTSRKALHLVQLINKWKIIDTLVKFGSKGLAKVKSLSTL